MFSDRGGRLSRGDEFDVFVRRRGNQSAVKRRKRDVAGTRVERDPAFLLDLLLTALEG